MAGIYIHIPFCRALCHYCNFYFSLSEERKEQMSSAILKEIELSHHYFQQSDKITTLYIGGGTPTLYSVEKLQQFIEKVKSTFGISDFEELTIEANPDDLTDDYLEKLSKTDCNRLSIGVQSFNNDILKFLNRRHDASEAITAIRNARQHGFSNISIDLIYGIPSQSLEMLSEDLQTAISLSPEHLSAYHLTIEKGSLFAKMEQQGKFTPIEESESEKHFALVSGTLRSAGYDHYEVSNFAKPNHKAIHNSSYWRAKPYLGIGPSAHSFDGRNVRRWNVASNIAYLRAIENSTPYYQSETLTPVDRYNEDIMTMLRTSVGVDASYIEATYGAPLKRELMKSSQKFIATSEIIVEGTTLRISPENFLKSDYIISSLFM
ncbi:MAG: radical SAM family heme chaperone HemW [Rikenellaceae bacterium]